VALWLHDAGHLTRQVRDRVVAFLPAFGFASYPILFIVTVNAGVLPLDTAGVVRGLAAACAGAAALLLTLALFRWDFQARAAWAGLAVLLFVFYRPILIAFLVAGWTLNPDEPIVAVSYVAITAFVVTSLVRPWQKRRRSLVALNAAAAILVAVNVYAQLTHGAFKRWPPDTAPHRADVLASQSIKPAQRDIYYLVLDGFGRSDILQSYYGLDITPFTQFLTARGFAVPDGARANYSQTYLSLASTLNLTYLDEVASAVGADGRDRRPLKHLIDRNALMAAAKAAGYRVYVIGSAYSATHTVDAADVCICGRPGFSELEHEALRATPLSALPLSRWTYDAHRTKTLDGFKAVEDLSGERTPKFVFAHIIIPHPPFVFGADGQAPRQSRPFSFQDGDQFQGPREEYVQGYRDQTRYLVTRLTALVERLMARPGAAPVIVMHGDHGPRSTMGTERGSQSDLHERMSIFAAYAFPGIPPGDGDPSISAVNVARTLARHYLGVDAPNLPDASYFSTWEAPYRFIPVGSVTVDAATAHR
jgi:hypothetical protein